MNKLVAIALMGIFLPVSAFAMNFDDAVINVIAFRYLKITAESREQQGFKVSVQLNGWLEKYKNVESNSKNVINRKIETDMRDSNSWDRQFTKEKVYGILMPMRLIYIRKIH